MTNKAQRFQRLVGASKDGSAPPNSKTRYGVIALAPSFNRTKDWEAYGALIGNE
jgi:hypothetical protein